MIGLLAAIPLAQEKIVLHELISEVRKPAAAGLGHMIQFPFSLVRIIVKKARVWNDRKNQR